MILKIIPNVYLRDFNIKTMQIFRVGTKNLFLTISLGAAVQSNKSAIFGGLFQKGVLEVSAFLGIKDYSCFAFSAGVTLKRSYIKTGLLWALSDSPYGAYLGLCVEISVPTWVLAAAAVVTAAISVYAPAAGAYVVKTLSTIRASIKAAAPILIPIFPKLVEVCAR